MAVTFASVCLLATDRITAATISGAVIDADLRTPLASKTVAVYSAAGTLQASATSDFLGHYVLGLPAGDYRVLAYDPTGTYATTFGNDADSFEASPVVTVIDTVSILNFGLRKSGSVTGTVFSIGTGLPLTGLTVAAYNAGSGTRRGFLQTDSRGRYSLALPPGAYKLAAYDDQGAFAPRFFLDQPTFTAATPVTVAAGRAIAGIDLRLDFAAHFTGVVVDADTAVVLPGMTVFAYTADGASAAATVKSSPAGNFMINVPAGSYKLVAADPSGNYGVGFVDDVDSFAAQRPVSVGPSQVRENLRIPLHRAGTVMGRVQDSPGSALTGITVGAYNADGSQRTSVETDKNGAYSLALPPGAFRIGAYDNATTYATQFYPRRNLFRAANIVVIAAGQIMPAVDFTLLRGARFSGVVKEAATGLPISGISIASYDSDGNLMASVNSDASGNYALVLPPGSFKFAAFDALLRYATAYALGAPNYESSRTYQVDEDSSHRMDFALSLGVRITGTVVDDKFRAVSGAQVGALDVFGNRVATTTTFDGVFDIVLMPNTYKLLATDPLQRYKPSFFNGASSLASATPIIVQSSGANASPTFVLTHSDRRRSIPH